jgi:transcriptional regulator with XRE-family HTH domain
MGMTGANLKALRESAGLNQIQLADLCQTGQVTISRYETDERGISKPMALLFRLAVEQFTLGKLHLPKTRKPTPKFKKGDKVIWLKNPEYNYRPGTIHLVKNDPSRDNDGKIMYWGSIIYKIINLGPFDYYWLEESDIDFAPLSAETPT